MEKEAHLVEGEKRATEKTFEKTLRPSSFEEFPGQEKIKEKLKVFIQAALQRKEPLDHVLLNGPAGLGKTTLAHLIAHHMKAELRGTSGPALRKKGDIAALLTSLKPGSVLFIDEIHRLSKDIEEYLYTAMEDFYIDIVTGEGLGAKPMRFQIVPFTLVGATTRTGLLRKPFSDRFGITEHLEFYEKEALGEILERSCKILGVDVTGEALKEIGSRSRRTPRVANRLLKRVRDYAQVEGKTKVDKDLVIYALKKLGVDLLGLTDTDRKILDALKNNFSGGPVGIDTLAASLGEDVGSLEETYEPFLIQEGLIHKTPRGRAITTKGLEHLEGS